MNSIGIRVTPSRIFYSIISEDKDRFKIETNDHLIIPVSLDLPQNLTFIRTNFFSILKEYNISKAGIRIIEPTGMRSNLNLVIKRINIEGVLLELFANSNIEKYFTGIISSIAGKLEVPIKEVKPILEGKVNHFDVSGWEKFSKEEREAITIGVMMV